MYIYLILVIFRVMEGVVRLGGMGGVIVGVGMGVEGKILRYERVKEEMRVGRWGGWGV